MTSDQGHVHAVLIVEDHAETRAHLQRVVDAAHDLTVVGAHESIETTRFGESGADLILLDLDLPGMHGADAVGLIRDQLPAARIVVHTVFEDVESIVRCIGAGVDGYLLKGMPPDLLVAELRVVLLGGAPMTSRVADHILQAYRDPPEKPPRQLPPMTRRRSGPTPAGRAALTAREEEVLSLMSLGLTYKEAAYRLGVGVGTVRKHIEHIYRKLKVNSKVEAINAAWPRMDPSS